jgi:hypothetical protein
MMVVPSPSLDVFDVVSLPFVLLLPGAILRLFGLVHKESTLRFSYQGHHSIRELAVKSFNSYFSPAIRPFVTLRSSETEWYSAAMESGYSAALFPRNEWANHESMWENAFSLSRDAM